MWEARARVARAGRGASKATSAAAGWGFLEEMEDDARREAEGEVGVWESGRGEVLKLRLGQPRAKMGERRAKQKKGPARPVSPCTHQMHKGRLPGGRTRAKHRIPDRAPISQAISQAIPAAAFVLQSTWPSSLWCIDRPGTSRQGPNEATHGSKRGPRYAKRTGSRCNPVCDATIVLVSDNLIVKWPADCCAIPRRFQGDSKAIPIARATTAVLGLGTAQRPTRCCPTQTQTQTVLPAPVELLEARQAGQRSIG